MKKEIVVDTNVLIENPKLVNELESDIFIPYVVLEELDGLKNKGGFVGKRARDAVRNLKEYVDNSESIEKNKDSSNNLKKAYKNFYKKLLNRLDIPTNTIEVNKTYRKDESSLNYVSNSIKPISYIYDLDSERKDNIILNIVKNLSNDYENLEFYTNDYNLYIKADSLDIDTHVYTPPVKKIYKGYVNMKLDSYNDLEKGEMELSYLDELIEHEFLKPEKDFLDRDPINNKTKYYQNEYIFFNDDDKTYHVGKVRGDKIIPISLENHNWRIGEITPKNLEQLIALDALLDPEISNVSLVGRAGTGKTFLGIAASYVLSNLNYNERSSLFGNEVKEHVNSWYEKYKDRSSSNRKMISKTLFSRPLLDDDKLGFLPGDIESKMSPWLRGAFENLKEIINSVQYANQKNNGFDDAFDCFFESGQKDYIDVIPLQYERGDSVSHKYWLVDEAQDLYNSEAKLVGTRMGKGSKLVLTGDPGQIGRKSLHRHHNGLVHMIDRLKESSLTSTVFFKDVERSQFSDEVSKYL